jgi:hypothetical protein
MAGWRTVTVRDATCTGLILASMVAFVAGVYVVVVLGGGALVGQSDSPHLGLSVLATMIVALGFGPVVARVRPWAVRLVHRGRAAPARTPRLEHRGSNTAGREPRVAASAWRRAGHSSRASAAVMAEGHGHEWVQAAQLAASRTCVLRMAAAVRR